MTWTIAQVASLFTMPWLAAAGALAVGIPIAIHLLSRFRRKRQAWGAMRFVWEAYRRQKRRLQMEQWLLLAVRCLMVLVLGLALAGPVLTGCSDQLRAVGLLQERPRTVHVVVDRSLSTQAVDVNDRQRFETLREMALAVVDGAAPTDEVRVWWSGGDEAVRASGGGGSGPSPLAQDRSGLAEARAGFGGGGMDEAVARVAAAIEAEGDAAMREHVVVLISDWSRSSLDPQRGASVEAVQVPVFVSHPLPEAGNVQVMSVTPRRRVVVAEQDGSGTAAVEVRVRRFDGSEAVDGGTLHLALLDAQGRALMQAQRSVAFAAGQSTVTLSETLRLPAALMRRAAGQRPVVVRATLSRGGAGGLPDALTADNERYAVIELRSHLAVALMTPANLAAASAGAEGADALTPERWLSLALSPRLDGSAGPMEVTRVTAANLGADDAGEAVLGDLDAVFVTRPHELSALAWSNLASFVESGGLLWVMPSADEPSAMWTGSVRDAFSLDWQLALEPADVGGLEGVSVAAGDVPGALSMLGADWEALLRPVRVHRWLPLWVPQRAAWVALEVETGGETGGEAGASTGALLAYQEHGRGALLVMSASLAADWTNVPTKPVFVPLVHEALRGLAGRGAGRDGVLVGEPVPREDGGREMLTRLVLGEVEAESGPSPLASDRLVEGEPATRPGVYGDGEGLRLLPVNVDPDAGDTRALDEAALSAWLDALGPWQFLDRDDPGSALRQSRDTAPNLGWPLLWILLGLVLLETVLARVLSHARVEDRRGLAATVIRRLRRIHVADHDDQRRAA